MSGMTGMLSLNDDVMITPVAELPDEARAQVECSPDAFAVTRIRGRGGSSIIDAASARLLDRFRDPRTVAEAVILFARDAGTDAGEVLEGAYPFLKNMVQRQVLVAASQSPPPAGTAPWSAGTRLAVGEIARTLQALDDGEVYQIVRPDGELAILKIARARPGSPAGEDPGRLGAARANGVKRSIPKRVARAGGRIHVARKSPKVSKKSAKRRTSIQRAG